ncbi:MAG: type I restriction-modification system subunit M [Succinivibrio dextrinosolvens]|nr:type I restriction-modification system subunit M [Succinivibrio dextrinosolvens]
MNKQQLASKIWESANKMRSKIEANEYKDYILGFIFYKFLSNKEVQYLKNELQYSDEDLKTVTEGDEQIRKNVQQNIGYFIEYNNLFSTWLSEKSDFSADSVNVALGAFSRLINKAHKKVFAKIFDTLQTGLSKLGDSSAARTKAIRDLLYLINDIPMDGKQDYDVIGFIYEYLIEKFAANAGKKAGEFYTPHEVSVLMSEIVAYHLRNKSTDIKIYDPTSGSGSLLINIGKAVSKYSGDSDNIKYYAQEIKENTYNLTRMNLVMRGILPDNIETRRGDTLEDDWPYFDEEDPLKTYEPLYVDAVVSNPPYSQAWDPSGKDTDPRYKTFGLAPKGKADYAFLLHDLYHINPSGIMNIVLPHGVLFRGGEEGEIRKNLIEKNNIDTIIGLPANIFYGTGIPTIIMVLKQKRENTDVLFIDASKYYEKEGKSNKLRASDIKRIVDAYVSRTDIHKYAKVVSREQIRANDYNLNIPRYIDSSEKNDCWDIYAQMFGGLPNFELDELNIYWKAFPSLRRSIFKEKNEAYSLLVNENLRESILSHNEVMLFKNKYIDSLKGLDEYLRNEIVENFNTVDISKEEEKIFQIINLRIKDNELIDKYHAYQFLDDQWSKIISGDLEILQTEGFVSVRQVDPNMVVKKKDNKEIEIQDGWKGHVLPFELVQNNCFQEDLNKINAKEEYLAEILSSYSELIESFDDELKEKDFISEDTFVWAEVKKALKEYSDDAEIVNKLKKASSLNAKEKNLKKEIKILRTELEIKTKKYIEEISDTSARDLLFMKWCSPLLTNLLSMSNHVIDGIVEEIQKVCSKYENTFSEINEGILNIESSLTNLTESLVCNEFDLKGIEEFRKILGAN